MLSAAGFPFASRHLVRSQRLDRIRDAGGGTLMAGRDDTFDIVVVGAGPVGLSFA
ncbi:MULTISPECIES: hypothetical protein [Mesorhizobium]|uniref:hypothetical protein n=1 Tax=Mesorhizobium TaxID=68287 RepID=UPI0013158A55|nr:MULTISPECIES: hypothetical protein [Mesorhizobium]